MTEGSLHSVQTAPTSTAFTGLDPLTVERIGAFFDHFVHARSGNDRFDLMFMDLVEGLRRTLSGREVIIWVPSELAGDETPVLHPAYTTLPDEMACRLPMEIPVPGELDHAFFDTLTDSDDTATVDAVLQTAGMSKTWWVPITADSPQFREVDTVIAVAQIIYPPDAPAAEIPAEIATLCGRLAGRAIERSLWTEQDRVIEKGFEALDSVRKDRFQAADGICSAIAELMHFEACTILLADSHTQTLHLLGTTGIDVNRPRRHMRYPYGFSCSGKVADEKRIVATENLDACRCFEGPKFTDHVESREFRQYLGAPILSHANELLGVIRLRNKRPPHERAWPRCLNGLDWIRIERTAHVLAPVMSLLVKDVQSASMMERVRHDMDMPATMIRDSAGHLRRLPPGQLTDRIDEVHQKLEDFESLAEILLLNSELLRVQDATDLPFEPEHIMPMGDFVAKLCKMLTPAARRKDLAGVLYVDDTFRKVPRLWLDPRFMQIAMYNLLQNAIKYSSEGTLIIVEGEQARVDGEPWYMIHVKNKGIGIADDEVDRIFERHYRTPRAVRRNSTGLGIGLPIARAMIERHGGKLVLTSLHDPTVFTIQLPGYLESQRPDGRPENTST